LNNTLIATPSRKSLPRARACRHECRQLRQCQRARAAGHGDHPIRLLGRNHHRYRPSEHDARRQTAWQSPPLQRVVHARRDLSRLPGRTSDRAHALRRLHRPGLPERETAGLPLPGRSFRWQRRALRTLRHLRHAVAGAGRGGGAGRSLRLPAGQSRHDRHRCDRRCGIDCRHHAGGTCPAVPAGARGGTRPMGRRAGPRPPHRRTPGRAPPRHTSPVPRARSARRADADRRATRRASLCRPARSRTAASRWSARR
jgi:hypothetical protein